MSTSELPSIAAYEAIELLHAAAQANREDPYRQSSLLDLDDHGQVVMTGDLHGHLKNFQKLVRYANLAGTPARHIVLHELLHTPTIQADEPDPSFWLLIEAARYKYEFPEQVHFLLGNHEIAQLTGRDIVKDGLYAVANFRNTVLKLYGEDRGQDVLLAVDEFILSLPLAVRTPNRVFMAHSLPDASQLDRFDARIVHRTWDRLDAMPGGSVYMWLWGRQHNEALLTRLTELFDADLFIIGHVPQEMGYGLVADRLIILASEHAHGVFLPFDLRKPYSRDDLVRNIRKIASIP